MKYLKLVFCLVWVMPLLGVGFAIGLTILPIIGGVMMIKESFYVGGTSESDED